MSVPDNGITADVIKDSKVDNRLESITFTRGVVLIATKKTEEQFIKW